MNIHQQIRQALDQGRQIHSRALGRVGKVMNVSLDEQTVLISDPRTGELGVSTFLRGDPVALRHGVIVNKQGITHGR